MSEPPAPSHNQSPFDAIRHEDEQGEWWSARELAKELGYVGTGAWKNFARVIAEAQVAAASQGYDVEALFSDLGKKSTGGRPGQDYRLTRFACYMIALSADGSKDEVAAAKTYFAVKTREAELIEQSVSIDADGELFDGDPEEWLELAIRSYMARGFSEAYARNRIDSILARNRLTGQWVLRGIKQDEIPILTDRLHMGTFGISVEMHKGIKQFPIVRRGKSVKHKGNLRPALTPMEMAVLTFAENVTAALHEEHDSHGFVEIAGDVDEGSSIARDKRLEIESATGKPVVSPRNMIREPDGGLWGQLPSPEDE